MEILFFFLYGVFGGVTAFLSLRAFVRGMDIPNPDQMDKFMLVLTCMILFIPIMLLWPLVAVGYLVVRLIYWTA